MTGSGPTATADCGMTQTWTANFTDDCGNVAEEVSITYTWTEDNDDPVIATKAVSGDLGCNPTVEAPEFTLTEACSPGEIVMTGSGPTATADCGMTQTWTANFTDDCGNVAEEVSITYTWTEDLVDPVIATTATSGDLGCNPTVEAPVFTLTEACSPGEIVMTGSGPTATADCGMTQTWTANFTDDCGNVAEEVSITYTWTEDLVDPVITNCPVDVDFEFETPIFDETVTATDNCGDPVVSYVDSNSSIVVPGAPGVDPATSFLIVCKRPGYDGGNGTGNRYDFILFTWDGGDYVTYGPSGPKAVYLPGELITDSNDGEPTSDDAVFTMRFEEEAAEPNNSNLKARWTIWWDADGDGPIGEVQLATKNSNNNLPAFPECQADWLEFDSLSTGFNCKIAESVCLGSNEPGPGYTAYVRTRDFTATDSCGNTSDDLNGATCSVTYTWKIENVEEPSIANTELDEADRSIELDFAAYPVPFDSNVNVKFNFEFDTNVTINVHDTRGLLIKSLSLTNVRAGSDIKESFDLSRAGDQLFYITVITNQGSVTKKVVSSNIKN